MADGTAPWDAAAARTAPELRWRRPAWLWLAIVIAVSAAWPLFFLRGEGGWAQLAAISTGIAILMAAGAIAIARAIGKAPAQRRHVVIYVLAASVVCAIAAPFAFMTLLNIVVTAERNGDGAAFEIAGLSGDMAWALAPLALLVGAPCALIAGIALSLIAFKKVHAAPGGVLIAQRQRDHLASDPRREIDHAG